MFYVADSGYRFQNSEGGFSKIFVSPGCRKNYLERTFLKITVIRTKGITNMKKAHMSPEADTERFIF